MRSPPESEPTRRCWSLPLKLNQDAYARDATVRLPMSSSSSPPEISSQTVLSGLERVPVLIHVPELDGLAQPQRPRVSRLLPGDHPEQRRLAGAVRPDHADDSAARQREAQVVDQQAIPVALAQAARLHHDVAQARARRDVDLAALDALARILLEERLRTR